MPRKSKATKGTGKRYPLNMRTTKELRGLLEHAAALSGRSLVQEVEHRLDSTFAVQDVLIRGLGGPNAEAFVRPIIYYLGSLEKQGLKWRSDPEAVREGISIITEAVFGGALSRERQKALIDSVAHNKRGKAASTTVVTAMAVLAIFALTEKAQP